MTDRVDTNKVELNGGEEMHKTLADADTAERFITEKHLGDRIRRLRLKKSMGLVDLGRHTGLSASFLSQLETGRVVPTLRNLARIAMVFSKDLSYFFESEPTPIFRVHRKKDRVRIPQTGVESAHIYVREPWLHGRRPAHGSLLCRVHSPARTC